MMSQQTGCRRTRERWATCFRVLFPQLDVAANIAYGLSARKQPQHQIEARINELLKLMNIKHLASWYPNQLSGGERQRVALAMDLSNNFRRAIFISSLNAVMRYLGLVTKTVHCKDNEPRLCGHELVRYIEKNYSPPK
jgi:ABC-type arginine transport system ATPase subunit